MTGLTIGDVARKADVKVDTIRYYERVGIMPMPPRSRSGYRQYMPADVQRLKFIKRAQRLGFTLREITQLLELVFEPEAKCADVAASLSAKVDEIEHRITELSMMKVCLKNVIARCRSDCQTSCTTLLEESVAAR